MEKKNVFKEEWFVHLTYTNGTKGQLLLSFKRDLKRFKIQRKARDIFKVSRRNIF